ncbi:MAG: 4Fe-4S dicluster domain-containing protein [Chloroflexi bacterium]|nr:MAG: 4Fe-4S dicluster domain-containing protein [Chloroflexota bacterium]
MLTTIEKLLFLVVVATALYYAWRNFRLVYQVIRRGTGGFPSREQIVGRLLEAGVKWLSIRPIWKTRTVASLFHGLVAWGFVFYFLVNGGDLLQGYFPIRFLGDNPIGSLYRFLADLLSVAVLVGMLYFLVRRFLLAAPELSYRANIMLHEKVRAGGIRRDSLIVGLFILLHVGSRFLGESFSIALERAASGHGDAAQPFANAFSLLWGGLGANALTVGQHAGWWLALGLILAFLPYFPYTKHFHLMLSGVNFLTKPQRTSLGALEPENFEDETIEAFGVARLENLPWTHLADAYACIMCNRCQDVCPAYLTGKELSPAALEVNKRYYINGHMQEIAAGAETPLLLDYALSESALWACTACGACVDICPVGNEPMFDILYMRRHQVLMENSFPHELQSAYRGMERNGNPWNLSRRERMKWAGDLEIPTVDDNPDAEILWWVGCAPSYDPRAQQTAIAFAKVLNHAGVNYAVLGDRESCTGDSARRSGREDLFYQMATANIETLNEVKPKRIVATCPHCLHTLGKEYGQYGGHYEVIHHTQLLSELVAAKKLSYDVQTDGAVTFHDPCYLGRHNGIVDAPRSLLEAGNIQIEEMPRHGAQSFCCGAGGGQMWKEEEPGAAAVNKTRYDEARSTGAKTIAVGCPFCLTMMTDAAKSAGEGVAVKDVVELIAQSLQKA